jgi:multidrug efflux system membrane fusion protein
MKPADNTLSGADLYAFTADVDLSVPGSTNRVGASPARDSQAKDPVMNKHPYRSVFLAAGLLGLLAVSIALSGCGSHAAEPPPAPPAPAVSVAEVLAKDVKQWDEFSGRIAAVDSVEIRPRVSGYITEVRFKEGKEVRKGEVLFVIDPRPYKAELARAEADLARARAQEELAQSQAARASQLLEVHAISREEGDQRAAARAQARAGVLGAEAALQTAKLNVEFTEVRSPIDGRAGQALVTEGNLVSAQGNPALLTTVVSLDPVYVYFEGDESIYLHYNELARSGERASSRDARNPVRVGLANEDGFPHEGAMDFVDNQLNPATGTIRGRAVMPNKDRVFTPGLFARVKLLGSGTTHALLIDDKAVLTDQDRKYVYVLGPDNKALRRDVKLGRVTDGLRVVSEGLQPGDKVIVHGVQKIFFPGMPVQPQAITMGDPAPAPAQVAQNAPAKH